MEGGGLKCRRRGRSIRSKTHLLKKEEKEEGRQGRGADVCPARRIGGGKDEV